MASVTANDTADAIMAADVAVAVVVCCYWCGCCVCYWCFCLIFYCLLSIVIAAVWCCCLLLLCVFLLLAAAGADTVASEDAVAVNGCIFLTTMLVCCVSDGRSNRKVYRLGWRFVKQLSCFDWSVHIPDSVSERQFGIRAGRIVESVFPLVVFFIAIRACLP